MNLMEEIENIEKEYGKSAANVSVVRAIIMSTIIALHVSPEKYETAIDVIMKAVDIHTALIMNDQFVKIAKAHDNLPPSFTFDLLKNANVNKALIDKLLAEITNIVEVTGLLDPPTNKPEEAKS